MSSPVGVGKAFPVSWDQFHRDSRALAWRLAGEQRFDAIISVARGGLVPAAIIARELAIRLIDTLCVLSYDETIPREESHLIKTSLIDPNEKNILIIDDLVDTGRTAKIVREHFPAAHFATVYAKPLGRPLVDSFITEVSQDTWIYFPWDLELQFAPPLHNVTQP